MHPFLIKSAPTEETFDFFTYQGKPVTITYRGQDLTITAGTRFGISPAKGNFAKLIMANNKHRVFTIDVQSAAKLAAGVAKD